VNCRDLIARRIQPERFRVLGLNLKPMTLGHLAILESMGILNARDPGELGLCCLVCSTSHRGAMKRIESRWLPFVSWFWGMRIGKWDFSEKRELWSEYVKYNTQLPSIMSKASGTSDIPIPAYQTIRTVLLSRLNYSPETVDDTTFLQAQWDRITLAAIDGRVEVQDRTDDDIDEVMESIDWDKIERLGEKMFEA
jgi:hypothetical protein